ncbi:MAG: PstS family phosphate ABC transporter substrate-binding protein [Dehalococcoidia bacterium]|nr:PstS family phosphate ABC transporter substrate-binding protein [Dehalococcoidia bacterium]
MAALAMVSSLAVACGGDDDDDDATTTTTTSSATSSATGTATSAAAKVDYSKLSGELRIDGSSTVYPISEAAAEEFGKAAKGVRVNVALSGTGGGFEKFCRGETVISNASRPIKTGAGSETEKCTTAGIEPVEFQVAVDALTVVVSPQNTWAKCMTVQQLNMAYRAGGATKWSDIDPSWPDETITFYYPGADSGTFDYFKEAVIGAVKDTSHRTDGTSSEDDNVLVRGVEGDKNAIGYFGFAYYQEEAQKLKAVEIDGGSGCVAPTAENAISGKYSPLARPLFMYSSKDLLTENAAVAGFLDFVLANQAELNESVGYIPLPADALAKSQATLAPYIK